ncbi:MmgE/PrpD family protein [Paraburkholderia sp. BCC1886]|uniref:MmgE/PrpD family protein n=1 Tax=Paraburkholderia sp. BCC1886 TaxID=2562670 RepID=UPI001182923C|nr:MmgE/PrpD family protein [Paraburkholderia sp. BCC1886]
MFNDDDFMSVRRRLLRSAGALAALSIMPARFAFAADGRGNDAASAAGDDITGQLARYMVAARSTPLPDGVTLACKHRILDTSGAMVSGSRMRPGMMATRYVREPRPLFTV